MNLNRGQKAEILAWIIIGILFIVGITQSDPQRAGLFVGFLLIGAPIGVLIWMLCQLIP